jgi:hypothetical protein
MDIERVDVPHHEVRLARKVVKICIVQRQYPQYAEKTYDEQSDMGDQQ